MRVSAFALKWKDLVPAYGIAPVMHGPCAKHDRGDFRLPGQRSREENSCSSAQCCLSSCTRSALAHQLWYKKVAILLDQKDLTRHAPGRTRDQSMSSRNPIKSQSPRVKIAAKSYARVIKIRKIPLTFKVLVFI